MPVYTFHLANWDGSSDIFDLGAFDDEDAAERARAALLVSQTGVSAEVRREGIEVARIPRAGGARGPAAANPFSSAWES